MTIRVFAHRRGHYQTMSDPVAEAERIVRRSVERRDRRWRECSAVGLLVAGLVAVAAGWCWVVDEVFRAVT